MLLRDIVKTEAVGKRGPASALMELTGNEEAALLVGRALERLPKTLNETSEAKMRFNKHGAACVMKQDVSRSGEAAFSAVVEDTAEEVNLNLPEIDENHTLVSLYVRVH